MSSTTADLISSFASHLPTSLLHNLSTPSPSLSPTASSTSRIIQTSPLTPLFFIDISGFTAMSTILSVNDLSLVMNEYFTAIINVVTSFGGDVMKFAGDAIFVTFPPHPPSPSGHRLLLASLCADTLVQTLSSYLPALFKSGVGSKLPKSYLNVHCGLAYDDCTFCVLKSSTYDEQHSRSEFILFGKVIEEVGLAEGKCNLGEVNCCPKTREFLKNHPDVNWIEGDSDVDSDPNEPTLLCKKGEPLRFTLSPSFSSKILQLKKQTSLHPLSPLNYKKSFKNTIKQLTTDEKRIHELFYDVGSFVHEVAFEEMKESSKVHNELRPVYTVFLNILFKPGDQSFEKLDAVFSCIVKLSSKYSAMIRQFIVDDKGTVCILNYGLKGGVHKNMNDMLFSLLNSLENELNKLNVNFEGGVTLGKCYTGIVGSEERGEYAVMGSFVNLAARLMCADHGKYRTIASEEVKGRGGEWRFEENGEVKAKGFKNLIKTYGIGGKVGSRGRRMSSVGSYGLTHELQNDNTLFVGRDNETGQIMKTAESIYHSPPNPQLIVLIGEGGVGKSSLAKQAAKKLTRRGSKVMKSQCVHTGGVSYPLSSIKGWIRSHVITLMKNHETTNHDSDLESLLKNIGDSICFKGTVGNELLARSLLEIIGLMDESSNVVKVPLNEILLFTAEIIKYGHTSKEGAVLLLDDIQFIDSASKSLVELLMNVDSSLNLLIMATSRESLKIGDSLEIPVRAMGVEDLALLVDGLYNHNNKSMSKVEEEKRESDSPASKRMRKRTSRLIIEKSGDFLNELVNISGGNPFFASEILSMAQDERAIKRTASMSFSWDPTKNHQGLSDRISKLNSVSELILAKFDRLSAVVRSVLSVCSVIGARFMRGEVELLFEGSEIDAAFEELILSEIICVEDEEGGETTEDDVAFKFVHQLWATTVLENQLSTARVEIHKKLAERIKGGNIARLLKRLRHAREAGLAKIALEVSKEAGRFLILRGWNSQASELYSATLRIDSVEGVLRGEKNVEETELALEVMTDLAKVSASLGDKQSSARFYQSALKLYQSGVETGNVENNELSFAIVSGIMLLLKWGTIADEDGSYERNLVATFISSAQKAGNNAHVSRAFALKAVMFQRQENYDLAIEAQRELEEVYDIQLSSEISKHYGSDRGAQNYPLGAQFMYLRDGDGSEVREQVEKTVGFLDAGMMERRNVHNSFMLLFPLVLVLVEIGEAGSAVELWTKHILEPFEEFYTSEASVFFKPVFRPTFLWLRLKEGGGGGVFG